MNFSPAWLLFFGVAVPLLQASENTGIKMTITRGFAGRSSQQILYLQGDRRRVEFRNYLGRDEGPRLASITRCDLRLAFELNLDTSEYTTAPYPPKPLTKEEMERRGRQAPVRVADRSTLRIEIKTTDTGERKEIFGHMARHVITTRTQTPLEGSRSGPQETVTDGWYIDSADIDLNQRLSCDRKWPEGKKGRGFVYLGAGGANQPMDRPEFVVIGEPETGFAMESVATTKTTYSPPDGTEKHSDSKFETRVTQFEEGPLDPALFEIPSGFKLVDHIERNPAVSGPSDALTYYWQRIKASVENLFNR